MRISEKGIKLIEEFEGLSLKAYKDAAGVLTIGYGHTRGVKCGQTITKGQAEDYLKADLQGAENQVNKYLSKYNFNQNQFDALVSFGFNIGSIDQLTAKGTRSIETISVKILEYNKAGGKVLQGLVDRRRKEKLLFDTPADDLWVSVTAYHLNCRSKPNMSGAVLGTFAQGAKLKLIEQTNGSWFKVSGKAESGKTITGYCYESYLK